MISADIAGIKVAPHEYTSAMKRTRNVEKCAIGAKI